MKADLVTKWNKVVTMRLGMKKNKHNSNSTMNFLGKVKHIMYQFFKWSISSNGLQVYIAAMSLFVAIVTYNIAEKTFDYAALNFSLVPEFDIVDEHLTINNPDTDLFLIKNIEVDEYEEYRILDTNLYLFKTLSYIRTRNDKDNPTLNKISIDLNEPYQREGKAREMTEFKKVYQKKIISLKREAAAKFEQRFYVVSIDYLNLKNYQNSSLELEIYIDEKRKVTNINPMIERINKFGCFNFVVEYENNNFEGEWNFFMQFLNHAKERAKRN